MGCSGNKWLVGWGADRQIPNNLNAVKYLNQSILNSATSAAVKSSGKRSYPRRQVYVLISGEYVEVRYLWWLRQHLQQLKRFWGWLLMIWCIKYTPAEFLWAGWWLLWAVDDGLMPILPQVGRIVWNARNGVSHFAGLSRRVQRLGAYHEVGRSVQRNIHQGTWRWSTGVWLSKTPTEACQTWTKLYIVDIL